MLKNCVEICVDLWRKIFYDLAYYQMLSYWAFITTSLVEISYMYAFNIENAPIAAILIGISMFNIIFSLFLKTSFFIENSDFETLIRTPLTWIITIGLLIASVVMKHIEFTLLIILPFFVSFITVYTRNKQTKKYEFRYMADEEHPFRMPGNKLICILSFIVFTILPIVLLVVFIALIPGLSMGFKIFLPIVYILFIIPFSLSRDLYDITVFELFNRKWYFYDYWD